MMEEHLNIHNEVFTMWADNVGYEHVNFDNSEADFYDWGSRTVALEQRIA